MTDEQKDRKKQLRQMAVMSLATSCMYAAGMGIGTRFLIENDQAPAGAKMIMAMCMLMQVYGISVSIKCFVYAQRKLKKLNQNNQQR